MTGREAGKSMVIVIAGVLPGIYPEKRRPGRLVYLESKRNANRGM